MSPAIRSAARFGAALAAAVAVGACSDTATDLQGPGPVGAPPLDASVPAPRLALGALSAEPNPENAFALFGYVDAAGFDSVRLVLRDPAGVEVETPCQRWRSPTDPVLALGLMPETDYEVTAFACVGAYVPSAPVMVRTGAVPPELADVTLQVTGPGPGGLTVLPVISGRQGYVLVFDGAARMRWYRGFPLDSGDLMGDTRQLANGDFLTFIGKTRGWEPTFGRYLQIAPSGAVVAEHVAPAPFYTDNHDLLITFAGGAIHRLHLFGYDLRRTDLSPVGGPTDAQVAGHYILRLRPDGTTEFFWSGWDHFTLNDWLEPPFPGPGTSNIDFDHPNSLEIDHDGHYIASWRTLGEVTKVNGRNGDIIWRLGGKNNDFTFVNDPFNGFSAQHDARRLPNGNLLLYDNGWRHTPPETRVVEYALDEQAMTATLVWQFRRSPPIFTPVVGASQRLPNGNTLIGYGTASLVSEVTPAGAIDWEVQLLVRDSVPTLGFYRVRRITSLYGPGPS